MLIRNLRRRLSRWRVTRRKHTRNDEAYLLSSPANAARLLAALEGARAGKGTPVDIADLRAELGLDGQ